jgi:hypothetical protein
MTSHIYKKCYFFSYNTLINLTLDVLPFLQLRSGRDVGFSHLPPISPLIVKNMNLQN